MTRAQIVPLAIVLASACVDGDVVSGHDEDCDKCDAAAPDARQIAGRITRAVTLSSDADPARARTYCTLQPGDVEVAKFQGGKYRVYLPGRRPCASGSPDSFRGWVDATAVAIEDAAYFGKLRRVSPGATIDVQMSYAGSQIFCTPDASGKPSECLIDAPLYGINRCYVSPSLHDKIQAAASALARQRPGHKLAMLDCYRPIYVQQRMAELVSDPTWVAQPTPGRYGGHNSGRALDLSITDARGQLVDMGSGFDEFTSRSNYAAPGMTSAQRANRKLLRDVMTTAGFKPYDAEWWHFSLPITAQPLDLAL